METPGGAGTVSDERGAARTAWLAILVIVHFMFRPVLVGWPVAPDLLTGSVLLGGLAVGAGAAAGFGFVLGVLEGAMALSGIGLPALVYALLGYLTARWRDLFFADVPIFLFLYLFVGCWVTIVILAALEQASPGWEYVLVRAPISSALTSIVCGAGAQVAAGMDRRRGLF